MENKNIIIQIEKNANPLILVKVNFAYTYNENKVIAKKLGSGERVDTPTPLPLFK